MLFINRCKQTALLLIGLLLSGCQTTQEQANDHSIAKEQAANASTAESTAQTAGENMSIAEQMLASKNHYLTTQMIVSASAKQQFNQAVNYIKENKLSQAKELLHSLTLSYPTLSGPWLKLADIAMLQESPDTAQPHYQQAIDVNGHNYYARNRLASLLRREGQFEAAKSQYQHAISSWPGFVNSHRNLAILLDLYIGDKPEALKEYKLAHELDKLSGNKPDRQLKGWIADVTRQVSALNSSSNISQDNTNG